MVNTVAESPAARSLEVYRSCSFLEIKSWSKEANHCLGFQGSLRTQRGPAPAPTLLFQSNLWGIICFWPWYSGWLDLMMPQPKAVPPPPTIKDTELSWLKSRLNATANVRTGESAWLCGIMGKCPSRAETVGVIAPWKAPWKPITPQVCVNYWL